MLSKLCVTCAFALLLAFSKSAHATVMIGISDIQVTAGGASFIDVLIRGDGQSLAYFQAEFRITPVAGTTSALHFLEEDEAFLTDPEYLFRDNSVVGTDGLASSFGSVSTTVSPDDTFIGGDGTADFSGLNVVGSSLLVRLQVMHDIGAADPGTTIGHAFTIELIHGPSTFFANANAEDVPFSSSSGTVSVSPSVAPIPEPTSISILASCLVSLCGTRFRRRQVPQ